MQEIEAHIKDWIARVSHIRPELGGFALCPYASNAKYTIIQCKAKDIMPISGYDVIFYVVEDHFDLATVQKWVEYHNDLCSDYLFFEDCASYDTYIGGIQSNNGKYNLILAQPREKLRKFREKLAKTPYYTHWSDEYLREILGDDYDLVQKSG